MAKVILNPLTPDDREQLHPEVKVWETVTPYFEKLPIIRVKPMVGSLL